jgi:S-adenosylmethionine decarboxylase
MPRMKTVGRHVIAEFYDCDADVIDDVALITRYMRAAAEAVGATIVAEAFHRYAPVGVSGTLLISESHLSVHTWPEARYVAVDIFTCGGLDPRPGFKLLETALRAQASRMQEIIRGLPDDIEAGRTLLPDDVEIITRMASLDG